MREGYTSQAKKALAYAVRTAEKCGHNYVGTEHLLIGLLNVEDGTAGMVLSEFHVDAGQLTELIDRLIAPGGNTVTESRPGYTPRVRRVLENAEAEAARFKSRAVGTEHLLIAILKESDCVATRLLFTMGINIQKLYGAILTAMGEAPLQGGASGNANTGRGPQTRGGAQTSETPALDQYSRDLTELAREGKLDPVVGRGQEIERVIQILSRRTKNNPCLIGEPGVGKTAIAEGLAQRIALGIVPETIRDKRVVVLDLSGMVAGSKYRGEFEERIKRVVKEVTDNENILLFIDELHTIIGAGGAEGALDASNILKPSLSRGEIQLIGATTLEEYRKYIEKDAALERRFQPVKVEEPTESEALDILKGLRPYYERHHGVEITDEALEAAVKMSVRYINDRFLPDKAIDLIDEASAGVQLAGYQVPDNMAKEEQTLFEVQKEKESAISAGDFEQAKELQARQQELEKDLEQIRKRFERRCKNKKLQVTEEEIAKTVSTWTKIPVQRLAEGESKRLARLEQTLHKRVVGQEEAVTAVAKAVKRGRVGLKDPNRPTGSFLFLGPTGVGKTELSKALADAMFGSENALIRVDMSEFMEKHTVSKLIGSPPGYVGYDEGGQLSEKVRRNPYSVVLFDEVEKAHPDVFNVLLQVLDDGHITDSTGRVVDFKNTVIIMTSNAGAENIVTPKTLGFLSVNDEAHSHEDMKGKVMDEVKRIFKPEFINRIDEIIVFHTLGKEQIGQIVDIMMQTVNKRTLEQMKLSIELDEDAKNYLVEKGYDSKYGARPLRRAIQNEIEDPLAEQILQGKAGQGSRVKVTVKDGKLHFGLKRGLNK